ncbi:MAG: hypothetical protein IIA98_03770 [Proteobacteria bacterium]|nr:hypothetical protein [Pseudomonadota bacterium]
MADQQHDDFHAKVWMSSVFGFSVFGFRKGVDVLGFAIPPSFNDEWGEVCAELKEAEAAISKIIDTILGSR